MNLKLNVLFVKIINLNLVAIKVTFVEVELLMRALHIIRNYDYFCIVENVLIKL